MDVQNATPDHNVAPPAQRAMTHEARQPEKGAIGIAFLVWLFGGGLGLAALVFILLKIF